MHAHGVLVAEGLADGVDRQQGHVGGVEGVDAGMRGAAGVRGAADEARGLAEAAVVGARDRHPAVLGARRGVDHHRQVDVVEVAEAQQLALAAEELQAARPDLLESPLEVAALLGRHREEHDPAGEVLQRPALDQTERGAEESRHLRVVAAGVGRAMSANVGPGPAPPATSARTPVSASCVRGARPRPRNTSSTSAAVWASLKPSSGR